MKTIELPFRVERPVLACGADMKGAFALARGAKAYLEDRFGDLSDAGNLERYEKAVKALGNGLAIRPAVAVCDMHPGYFSTRFAEGLKLKAYGLRLTRVQHHEAHIASAIVENRIRGPVIGFAFDGTGMGHDGCVWGGEVFVGTPKRLRRMAHFEYVPMPGGDAAVREPWRMAATHLYRAFGEDFMKLKIEFVRRIDPKKWRIIKRMILGAVNSPLTSSAGRLFDAAASVTLSSMRPVREAELPVALEEIADPGVFDSYLFNIKAAGGAIVFGYGKIFKGIVGDLSRGVDESMVSARFHNTIAKIMAEAAARLGKSCGIRQAVLSGGVFHNVYLAARAVRALERKGFRVYTHSILSPGDSCIPLGQIAIAAARGICA